VTWSLLFPTSIIGMGAEGVTEDIGEPVYDSEETEDSLTRQILF
jgi:hypothetical protein